MSLTTPRSVRKLQGALYAKAKANPACRFHAGSAPSGANRRGLYRNQTLEKRVTRLCEKISQMTQRKQYWKETEELVGELNLVVKGWGNYFRLGSVSKAQWIVAMSERLLLDDSLEGVRSVGAVKRS